MVSPPPKPKGFAERLADGETILVAEGYLFEFERRGYLKAGAFVPEVVIEHPELVKQMHEEFVHAGSDVVEAFTYYAHREKLRLIGREHELEPMNRKALQIARQIADNTGTLMAGNLSNSTIWDPNDYKSMEEVREIFKEQVVWAVEEGADYIIAETMSHYSEAQSALQAMLKYGNGLPAVVTMAQHGTTTMDGYTHAQCCSMLEKEGAAVVGLNCSSGPSVMIEMMRGVRKMCSGPIAALPVPYKCTSEQPHMQKLRIPETGEQAFPINLDRFLCSSDDIATFGESCKELGIQYVGLCCGSCSRYMRRLAETLGRSPAASKYSPDMSQSSIFGNNDSQKGMYSELS